MKIIFITDIMIYFGEIDCQSKYKSSGEKCKNKAYYSQNNQYLCGMHSDKKLRTKLNKNPDKYKNEMIEIEKAAELNRKNGKIGDLIVTKLGMMKSPDEHKGYLKIFPNFKHQNRKDGYGCASLSPKSIGPINHGMPNIPIAKNLENYHQGAKIFPCDLDKNGKLTKEAIEYRNKMYDDNEPHRHKYSIEKLKEFNLPTPLYSLYYDSQGNEYKYSYIECRYFYCYWYDLMTQNNSDLKNLKEKLVNGYNLQICGYDGYRVDKNLYKCYLDPNKPFGHELVLYSILKGERPWEKYYLENKDKYPESVGGIYKK